MRIVIDQEFDVKGNLMCEHVVHTEVQPWNLAPHPDGVTGRVDAKVALKAIFAAPALEHLHGWDVISGHKDYQGKTRKEVFLAELGKTNDPSKVLFGVP
jgi:hypothetical protein